MRFDMRTTAGALLLALAGLPCRAEAGCTKAAGAPVVQLKVYAPLTAVEFGPATDVAIDASGCVTARFSAIDKRHGIQRFQMGSGEFAALKREIQAAKLSGFDQARLKAYEAAAPARAGQTQWRVSDPDIVELTLGAGIADAKAAPKEIRYTGLEGALLNRPDVAELQSLAAVKSRLSELASDARLKKEATR